MEKFKESLSKMLGLNRPPSAMPGIYRLNGFAGVEQGLFSYVRIQTKARGEKTWMINISDMYVNKYIEWDVSDGDTISVLTGLCAWDVKEFVTVSDFFLEASSPCEDEINLFTTTHPWAVSAINILAGVVFKEYESLPEIRAAKHNNRN